MVYILQNKKKSKLRFVRIGPIFIFIFVKKVYTNPFLYQRHTRVKYKGSQQMIQDDLAIEQNKEIKKTKTLMMAQVGSDIDMLGKREFMYIRGEAKHI